jgi:putative ABC transport system permease protein
MTMLLSWRLAMRELRGGIKGFRIFLACLMLGVAAIAGVGSLSSALVEGLRHDGRSLLGGDVELRLTHRPATPDQVAFFEANGQVSRIVEMRAMALRADRGKRALIELKGVDGGYPLYGGFDVVGGGSLHDLLMGRDGRPGALAEATLLARLGLQPGDDILVGEQTYRIAGIIAREPDRGADAFVLGPRLLVARSSLSDTGLIQEGSLVRYRYRIALPSGVPVDVFLGRMNDAYPDAGWRIRDLRNGAPGLRRFVDRMRLFLTLVGLTALLVGGLGVANAVRSYLEGKTGAIATLKCLGAPAGLIFRVYLIQVMALASLGIAAGLLLGGVSPMVAAVLLRDYLPFEAQAGFYPRPLIMAAVFGYLTSLAFTLWPLARAREVPGQALFRDLAAPLSARPRPIFILATASATLLLAVLAVVTADEPRFASWFVAGASGALLLFLAAGLLIVDVAGRLPRIRRPGLRLAIANLYRPGAATVPVVLSFGLGLSVLVAVITVQGNIAAQISDRLPERAPAFFFIDIQPDQVTGFEKAARSIPGVGEIEKVPSLRGRIVAVNGVPADQVRVEPDQSWVLRGDRGLTYLAAAPEHAEIVAGEWWPADYSGPPLISFGEEAARAMGIGVGDKLTVNVLGREITARIANLRRIDWTTMSINFVIIFAPGALEGAPHSFVATARATPEAELPLQTAVTDAYGNITAIRVRDALESVSRIVANIGTAIRATAAVTLLAGVLVLAGAVAAGHRRRVYDSVVLKVLGAGRRRILGTHLIEYTILGLVVAVLALLVGKTAAYVIITQVMEAPWVWLPGTAVATAVISLGATVALGMAATWVALGQRPAPLLRNE